MSQILDIVSRDRSTRCNTQPTEKAMDLPSGEKKGRRAPSLPRIRRAFVASSGRTHNPDLPLTTPMKATVRPSGEIAKPDSKIATSGNAPALRRIDLEAHNLIVRAAYSGSATPPILPASRSQAPPPRMPSTPRGWFWQRPVVRRAQVSAVFRSSAF